MQGFVSGLNESPVELFGKSSSPWWSSRDRRLIAAGRKCYRLVSFACAQERDQETLAKCRLVQIERVFVPNPGYRRFELREIRDWQGAVDAAFAGPFREYFLGERSQPRLPDFEHASRKVPPQKEGYYVPPGCWILPLVSPQEAGAVIGDAFGVPPDPASPGVVLYRCKFSSGAVLYLRHVEPCDVPGDALAEFAAWRQEAEREIARRLWEKDPLGAARAGVPLPPAPATAPAPAPAPPEYFASLEAAAKYARKTTRTIRNWIQRGWLNAERDDRKIRIARADVDKCIDRQ